MNKTIKAIIIDDEIDACNGIELLLNQYHPEIDVVAKCQNAIQGLKHAMDQKPHLLFLDIRMPGRDGFYIAKELQTIESTTSIIFITAYDQYAIRAIRHSAFDFITKPVDPDVLREAIIRFKRRKEKDSLHERLKKLDKSINPAMVRVITSDGFVVMDPSRVVYCIAEGNYTELVLNDDRRMMVCHQIGQVENIMGKDLLIRINRSYLVNKNFIIKYKRKSKSVIIDHLDLPDLPVSRNGLKRLMEACPSFS